MKGPEKNGLDEAFARAADGAFAIGPDGKIVLWNILGKLGADSRLEAVAMATRQRLL